MELRKAFLKASIYISSLGMSVSAAAQSNFTNELSGSSMSRKAVEVSHAPASSLIKPSAYVIPAYSELTNKVKGNGTRDFDHHQRYSYISINETTSSGKVRLRNIVTPVVTVHNEKESHHHVAEENGGLYFSHGYSKFTDGDIVRPANLQNVDMDKIAARLVKDKTLELRLTGHADTSGDQVKNQTLSEKRIETAKSLLISALKRQGLSAEDAQSLYEKRIAPHTQIIAHGETSGPVSTSDGVKEQGNRVVTFHLLTEEKLGDKFTAKMQKVADFDNHEHTVVLRLGAETRQKDLAFYPEYHEGSSPGQISIADENTNFIIKLDPNRQTPFTIKHHAANNIVADNTNFLIENDTPGAVSSTYNFSTRAIDVSVNGKVMIIISTIDPKIDPANIRIGQVDSKGNATVTPLTNLDSLGEIRDMINADSERTVLTNTADRIVHLSIDAKHLYMKHKDDRPAYLQALQDYKFEEKLQQAFEKLEKAGVETTAYEKFILNTYTNPNVKYFSPDQIVFPFQTYEGLYQSQSTFQPTKNGSTDAYKALMKQIKPDDGVKIGEPKASNTGKPGVQSKAVVWEL